MDRQLISFQGRALDAFQTDESSLENWLRQCLQQLSKSDYLVEYVFMNHEEHLELNKTSLNHNYYTDILTFDLSEDFLHAEIYINLDMVLDNAKTYKSTNTEELRRVLIHGILHLCGYDDHSDDERKIMRQQEDIFLSLK